MPNNNHVFTSLAVHIDKSKMAIPCVTSTVPPFLVNASFWQGFESHGLFEMHNVMNSKPKTNSLYKNCSKIYALVSQVDPVKPASHSHSNVLPSRTSMHSAPFLHGFVKHCNSVRKKWNMLYTTWNKFTKDHGWPESNVTFIKWLQRHCSSLWLHFTVLTLDLQTFSPFKQKQQWSNV